MKTPFAKPLNSPVFFGLVLGCPGILLLFFEGTQRVYSFTCIALSQFHVGADVGTGPASMGVVRLLGFGSALMV
jgi:hypothetical protein